MTSYIWIGTILASCAAFWTQLKGVIDNIASFVFLDITIDTYLITRTKVYLWNNLKPGRFNKKKYNLNHAYLTKQSKYAWYPEEYISDNSIYWKGWRFLIVKEEISKEGDSKFRLSSIRGMWNPDKLIAEIMDDYDRKKNEKKNKKFKIVQKQGQVMTAKGPATNGRVLEADKGVSINLHSGRPVGKTQEDFNDDRIETDPFNSLFYSKEIYKNLDIIDKWNKSKDWYKDKFIQHKLGFFLYGKPGTGKTSFIRSVGVKYDLPITLIDLSTMDNNELVEAWNECRANSPCIIVIEDIDRIFNKGELICKQSMNKNNLSMDCLLNCISGLEAFDGMLVFVTANDPSRVDKALLRSGRLDKHIEFKPLDDESRLMIAQKILKDYPELMDKTWKAGKGETGAEFTKRCTEVALNEFWRI